MKNPACKDCMHCVPFSSIKAYCTCYHHPREHLTPETPACRHFAAAAYPLYQSAWWRRRVGLNDQ